MVKIQHTWSKNLVNLAYVRKYYRCKIVTFTLKHLNCFDGSIFVGFLSLVRLVVWDRGLNIKLLGQCYSKIGWQCSTVLTVKIFPEQGIHRKCLLNNL